MSTNHDEAFHAILEAKYARIINEISNMYSVSLEEAMDIFYTRLFCLFLKMVLPIFIAEVINILPKRFGWSIIMKNKSRLSIN